VLIFVDNNPVDLRFSTNFWGDKIESAALIIENNIAGLYGSPSLVTDCSISPSGIVAGRSIDKSAILYN
jgi:hypothetical protein